MRNSWPWMALTSVAIAAASGAWAADTGGAGSPSAQGTNPPTPNLQGNDTRDQDANPQGGSDRANTGPSPRDQPSPDLRLDDRMKRLPAPRGDDGANGAQGNGNGADDATGGGAKGATPDDKVRPQNPAEPATPLFPANPHPPADPGEPGNPVTPTHLRVA